MGRISTHILDTSRGRPAEGVRIEVYAVDGEKRTLLGQTVTNADGRTDEPVVAMPDIPPGTYELLFHVGPYLTEMDGDAFYDIVPLRFRVSDGAGHYHVPLLITSWSYATYRGS